MYTRASVSTDRYNGDDSGSGRDETQNTTAVASDWSVRPSDETTADSVQSTGLSRLNPAATPFSFTGGSAAAAAVSGGAGGSGIGNDLLGSGSGGSAGGLPHQHHTHHTGMLAGAGLDTGLSPAAVSTGRGLGGGMNSSSNNNNNNNNNNGGGGMGGVDGGPAAFGMMQGMMQSPYGMGGGHRQGSLNSRSVGMMDYGMMHGNGNGGGGGGGGGVGRMGGGTNSPNSFLPPPGEDTDQQELMRLQQTNYRVKMLPPPLAYEVHRKIWSKNEYGDEDDDAHGCLDHQEEESLHSLVNEDPMDKEQRLEAYKQIMLRWYSHIHVLEGKSEVAKRLVRVRRTCPSLEEVVASLNNNNYNQQQQQQSGAATNMTGSDGGDEDTSMLSPQQQQQQQQPPPAATRRSLSDPADTEEILSSWSARCWDWWQETVKRKPRRARKQGDVPLGSGVGLPTSASAPMVTGMGDGGMPHSLSARAMDMEMSSPHMPGSGSPYTHHGSPYAGHANGSAMDVAGGMGMPMAPSYTSFTDLSEEGGMDGASRSLGQIPQQQQQQQQSRPSSHSSPQLPGQLHARSTPPQQQQQPQQAPSHNATPPASMFTTNGIRAAAPRSGNPDDFLENDHLTLAFTTELLKSLEE